MSSRLGLNTLICLSWWGAVKRRTRFCPGSSRWDTVLIYPFPLGWANFSTLEGSDNTDQPRAPFWKPQAHGIMTSPSTRSRYLWHHKEIHRSKIDISRIYIKMPPKMHYIFFKRVSKSSWMKGRDCRLIIQLALQLLSKIMTATLTERGHCSLIVLKALCSLVRFWL